MLLLLVVAVVLILIVIVAVVEATPATNVNSNNTLPNKSTVRQLQPQQQQQGQTTLIQTPGTEPITSSTSSTSGTEKTLRYHCTFRSLWTKGRMPIGYPEQDASWGGPILFSHSPLFEEMPQKPALKHFAEHGSTTDMIAYLDLNTNANNGTNVGTVLEVKERPFATHNLQQEGYFIQLPPIQVDANHNTLSAFAKVSPSPDWYTQLQVHLVDETQQVWYDHFQIQTLPWDAGTDAGRAYYTAQDDDTDSPLTLTPPTVMTPDTAPWNLRSADGRTVPNIAEWECILVVNGPDDYLPLVCDWLLDPCCNETTSSSTSDTTTTTMTPTTSSASSCLLPNGQAPIISNEVAQVLAELSTPPDTDTTTTTHAPTGTDLGLGFLDKQFLDTCNYLQDECPFSWQFDHDCDQGSPQCRNNDCFDCDRCAQFTHLDCQSCTDNGCYWCPGDAVCQSQPLGEEYWAQYNGRKVSSCPLAEDWITDTACPATDNVFSDPLYDANQWIFDLIHVVPVWRQGITGNGVHGE